jgi:tripartite ATP-independent transporter DctP family solute receptor
MSPAHFSNLFRQGILTVIGMALLSTAGLSAAQETLRAAHSSNPGQSVYIYWEELAKRVNEKAQGKLKIQVFPSGQLGADEQIIQAIKAGTVHMGSASNGNMGSTTDAYFWMDLPHVFQSRDSALRALNDNYVKSYLENKVRTDARAVVLGNIEVGGFRILANRKREIRVPADTKGMKFRSLPSPVDRALWEAWGATPSPLPWSETFVSLEQGVIDGVNLQPQALVGFKFDDVVKYGTMTNTLMAFHVALMNAQTWDKLTPEMRTIVSTAANESLQVANDADRRDEAGFVKRMEAKGIKFHRPTSAESKSWSDAARAIWPKFDDKINKELLNRVLSAQGS